METTFALDQGFELIGGADKAAAPGRVALIADHRPWAGEPSLPAKFFRTLHRLHCGGKILGQHALAAYAGIELEMDVDHPALVRSDARGSAVTRLASTTGVEILASTRASRVCGITCQH